MMDMCFNGEVTVSDIISLFGVAIGIWIAITVQRNLNTALSIKGFHTDELKNIRSAYASFFNDLRQNKRSATDIKDWLKVMSNRVAIFEASITNYYSIKKSQIILSSIHSQFQIYITGTDDFNENFRKSTVILSNPTKDEVFRKHGQLTSHILEIAIRINTSSKRSCFCKK